MAYVLVMTAGLWLGWTQQTPVGEVLVFGSVLMLNLAAWPVLFRKFAWPEDV